MRQLVFANLMFFIPMAMAGFVLFGELPAHSVLVRGALRGAGLLAGLGTAALVLAGLGALV